METTERLIADRYALGRALGRGGMGVVWLAEDRVLQRQVAVKEVSYPPGVGDAEMRSMKARVMREARAAARLNHANVTTVYDVIEADGHTFIVMEFVDGPTLNEVVAESGPLSPKDAAVVGLSVLSALQAAHAEGIVHRDVKPGNVMVTESGRVKLADFGVAALAGDPKITMTGFIVGSPSYMAPEQAFEGDTGPGTDLWGLGATLYFAVEGEPPFKRAQTMATLSAVTHEPHRPMELAGPLGPVVDALLTKDPAHRPDAAEARRMLEGVDTEPTRDRLTTVPLVAPGPPTEPDIEPLGEPTPVPPAVEPEDDDDTWTQPAYRSRRDRSWPALVGALALLGIGALLVWALLAGRDADPDLATQDPAPTDAAEQPTDADAAADPEPADDGEEEEEPAEQEPATDETAVPQGWETYTFGPGGSATVAHPPGWTERTVNATTTDLIDPEGGRYLRVAWTDAPKDDPVADWQAQSQSFGSRHSNYETISIEAEDYRDYNAALWEYRYTSGGTQLHAYNLGFVAGDNGYALNFQTREDQFEPSQELFEQFKASFDPA